MTGMVADQYYRVTVAIAVAAVVACALTILGASARDDSAGYSERPALHFSTAGASSDID
jgi:hypothetical protein